MVRLLDENAGPVFQDVPNVLVSNCGPRFFSIPLPGSILLVLDFINAAGTIISAVDYKEVGTASFSWVLCLLAWVRGWFDGWLVGLSGKLLW